MKLRSPSLSSARLAAKVKKFTTNPEPVKPDGSRSHLWSETSWYEWGVEGTKDDQDLLEVIHEGLKAGRLSYTDTEATVKTKMAAELAKRKK